VLIHPSHIVRGPLPKTQNMLVPPPPPPPRPLLLFYNNIFSTHFRTISRILVSFSSCARNFISFHSHHVREILLKPMDERRSRYEGVCNTHLREIKIYFFILAQIHFTRSSFFFFFFFFLGLLFSTCLI
jgi:hypothetical protein